VGLFGSLFGKKNPLTSINRDNLKISEIQLKKKIEDIHTEIQRLENEEKRLLAKGQATASNAEKKSISGQVIYIREQKTAQLATQAQIQSQLRSVSNLIIIKEQWKDLPQDVQKVLLETPPEKIEGYLIDMALESEGAAERRSKITEMTNTILGHGVDISEDTDGILPELLSAEQMPESEVTPKRPRREFE